MSIRIYTVTHVPFTPPEDPVYIPLQVGRASHPDYGYTGDNTGENISEKNPYYSELTGLYWIWKNDSLPDYLGLCHYRRYFLNNAGSLMNENEYMDILSKYDVIIARPQLGQYDYRTVYERSHDIRNLEQTGILIRELYPAYYEDFQAVIADKLCYVGNLFVAPRSLFHAYCDWLFTLFSALEKRIDTSGYDDYHKRVFGFLSEQLLFVWIRHNRLSCYECPFGLSQEKAETIQLKETLEKYILAKDIAGAHAHLNAVLNRRPDLALEMSDFHQDLTAIEHIINICRIEQEAKLPTLLSFSCDFAVLIKHFRLLLAILEHIRDNNASAEEIRYLIDCRVSHKAVLYMLQNFPTFTGNPVSLLNLLAVIYTDSGNYMTSLSFLEEALALQETNPTTLSNIVNTLQHMGQHEMAAEYEQFLRSLPVSQADTPQGDAPKHFVLFTGSDIPILDYIAGQYRQALQSLGHNVLLFDKQRFEESMEALFSYQKNGLDGVFVFNNACFQMRLQSGESLWDLWQIPCYNVLVDHPMYYFDTLDDSPACGIVVCADKYHADYVRRFYPKVRHTVFLPTAGEWLKPYEALKPFSSRPIDVLFIGSYKYHADVEYDAFARLLEKELLAHPAKTFEQAVEDCLLDNELAIDGILSDNEPVSVKPLSEIGSTGGKSPSDVQSTTGGVSSGIGSMNGHTRSDDGVKLIIQKYRFIDVNTTAKFRLRIIESLVNAGIPVTVYGNGWETLDVFHHPDFVYKGLIAPEEGIRLMEESKIVLNHMAWFKCGASERIFEAMLQGAISVTDDSEYLRAHFTDSVDIKFFDLSQPETLPDIIHALLIDQTMSESIRRTAYEKAAAHHTWLNRLQELLS